MAIICAAFWKIDWISSWKEVAALYGITVVIIIVSTLSKIIKRSITK